MRGPLGMGLNPLLAVGGFLLADLHVQLDDLLAHHLVLVHEREVKNGHPDQGSNRRQRGNHTGQPVPDAGVDVHLLGG